MPDVLLVLLLLGLLSVGRRERGERRITVQVKEGVKLEGITPEALFGVQVVASVFQSHPEFGDLVITSVLDGTHMVNSLHYSGDAFDFRTRHLSMPEEARLAVLCRDALGPNYDVVVEPTPENPTVARHIHVEFQPKEPTS